MYLYFKGDSYVTINGQPMLQVSMVQQLLLNETPTVLSLSFVGEHEIHVDFDDGEIDVTTAEIVSYHLHYAFSQWCMSNGIVAVGRVRVNIGLCDSKGLEALYLYDAFQELFELMDRVLLAYATVSDAAAKQVRLQCYQRQTAGRPWVKPLIQLIKDGDE